CALIANAIAGRERKLAIVGTYPNATKIPTPSGAPAPPPAQPEPTTTTVAPAPTPTTTTIAPPPPAKTTTTATPPPQPRNTAATPQQQFTAHPDKPYIEIAYDSVKQLYDKKVLFLDARRTSVYEQGHIAGARPFSVWESDIDEKVKKLFEERGDPQQQAEPIVVYCSGGDCEDSHMLAQKLWGIQYNNVYVYKDGFPDWAKRGGAVHTGAAP